MGAFMIRDVHFERAMRALLLCGSAMAWASPAVADSAANESDGPEIVVTGTRPIAESEAAALDVQKNSNSLVTVASSDSVGRLADQNVAQAVSRLPGLAVESDQGQPRYVSIRGAPNYWTTLSFDGVNVVSPEGRDARFDSVPSAMAKQIVVSKAVTPDMPGETVAGNVNIVTRSAFDYSGFHIAGKLGAGAAEYGRRPQYEVAAVISDRFQAGSGEIGVLLSGSFFQRNMITDNFENDYEKVPNDTRPGNETRYWVAEAENKLYRLIRRNWSVSGRVDWKPDADNTVSLRSIYTIFKDDEARNNYRFDMDDRESNLQSNSAACPAVSAPATTSGYADVCTGNTPLAGTIYGIDIRQRETLRAYRQSIFTNTLEGEHKFGEGWALNWLGNYAVAKDDRTVVGEAIWESPTDRTLRPTVQYDFTDPNRSRLLLFTTLQTGSVFSAGPRVIDIDSFTKRLGQGVTFGAAPGGNALTVTDAIDTTKAYTARLFISKDLALLGGEATLKAGFQFDQRTKTVDESSLALTQAQAVSVGVPIDYHQFSVDLPFQGQIPLDYTFHYYDTDKMQQAGEAARAKFTLNPATGNIYDVREQVYAGFLMGTLRYDWGSIVGGVRVEQLKNRGIAAATITPTSGPTTSSLVTAESSHTLVLPSLHINYNIDDTKKFRLSFNSGAARADYDQMRPNFTVSDTDSSISGGNPFVKPERAYGVDAYLEWYVRPQGYLMIGAFYKNVKDVLYTQRGIFNSDVLNSGGMDRSGYKFSRITNGGDGRIYGIEAAAQLQLEPWTQSLGLPDWMGGFGLSANITVNNSEVEKPAVPFSNGSLNVPSRRVRLPGTSDLVYNLGGYYEKYGLSLRLQYQYRSKWLDGIADDDLAGGDTYWAADDELSFSARYAINKNFEVYFDATNLLNKPGRRYSDPGNILTAKGIPTPDLDIYTIEWERFGRRYSGGVRFTF